MQDSIIGSTFFDEDTIARLAEEFSMAQDRYTEFCKLTRRLLHRLCDNAAIQATTEARVKKISSLASKLRDKRKYATLDEVPDLVGLRLIVRYRSDIDKVEEIIYNEFTVIDKSDHEFKEPESFGYQSRHLVVSLSDSRRNLKEWARVRDLHCEIQIRTMLQHAWAAISHALDYKSPTVVPSRHRRELFKLAALLESVDDGFDRYRERVISLRNSYGTEADWRNLPVDIYSLALHWSKLPHDSFKSALENIGIEVQSDKYPDDRILGQIVRGAEVASLQTLGALERYILSDVIKASRSVNQSISSTAIVDLVSMLTATLIVNAVATPPDLDYILGIAPKPT